MGLEQPSRLADVCHAALDLPFLLLPFRPTSDPSAVRTFVRHFFDGRDGAPTLRGAALANELRMTEPMVGKEAPELERTRLTTAIGRFWRDQVVLEQTPGWCCGLGLV